MIISKAARIALADILSDRIDELFNFLEIDYTDNNEYYGFTCPIHEGADNPQGCTMTVHGEWKGAWKCWTRGCEKEHTHSIMGFVRAVLSERRGKNVTFPETVGFCKEFLKISDSEIKDRVSNMPSLLERYSKQTNERESVTLKISRRQIRNSLSMPPSYYLDRGYSEEVLNKFDVGNCNAQGKQMNGRIVAPVYDENYKYVGCVGRTPHENNNGYKWINSKYFHTGSHLYGYWLAKDKIRKTKTIILVEGQGDVWRLHEAGIENCVGIFGSSLSDAQSRLIQTSGALTVVILTDNDEAGQKAKMSIREKCSTLFNIIEPEFSGDDMGDMTIEEIIKEIKPQLDGKYA